MLPGLFFSSQTSSSCSSTTPLGVTTSPSVARLCHSLPCCCCLSDGRLRTLGIEEDGGLETLAAAAAPSLGAVVAAVLWLLLLLLLFLLRVLRRTITVLGGVQGTSCSSLGWPEIRQMSVIFLFPSLKKKHVNIMREKCMHFS